MTQLIVRIRNFTRKVKRVSVGTELAICLMLTGSRIVDLDVET